MKKLVLLALSSIVVSSILVSLAGSQATSNYGYPFFPSLVAITGGTITGTSISGSTGSFTTLAVSGTVSGVGLSTYLASPPAIGATAPATITATTYSTATNCAANSVSPAACGSASSGAFVIPATTATYTVNTTAITAHSRILLQPITFASDLPSTPTCVAPLLTTSWVISTATASTSFTMTLTSTTGQTCWYYTIIN